MFINLKAKDVDSTSAGDENQHPLDILSSMIQTIGENGDDSAVDPKLKDSMNDLVSKSRRLIAEQQKEIQFLKSKLTSEIPFNATQSKSPCLSKEQLQQLKNEIQDMDKIGAMGFSDFSNKDDPFIALDSLLFDGVAAQVSQKCPMIDQLIKTLAIGARTNENLGKKTEDYKFKAAMQVLYALNDIRSQKANSDFCKLFG